MAFEPLPDFNSAQFIRLWNEHFQRFPRIEEQPPYVPPIERFGRASILPSLRLSFGQPAGRYWFVNQDGTELIQIQRDWFARNWRRVTDDVVYPHFASVSEPFASDLERLIAFVEQSNLGKLVPTQCEVTYVNRIDRRGVWGSHSDADRVFATWRRPEHREFLPLPEDQLYAIRYVIPSTEGDPIGRLNVQCQPGFTDPDQEEPIFMLNLTARGAPVGIGIDGVRTFLDIGHEWIVRAFTELTTVEMHTAWERYV
jgi:uncharacterized protein (TIGR04255 family)